jgi:nucleotide-binding universal stress UspA family protein
MYKVIVVGTDGSARADRAVEEATALAALTGATLHVVHVLHAVSMAAASYGDPGVIASSNADSRDHGDQVLARVKASAEKKGVTVETHNVDGDPADMLVKVATAAQADVVVVGNRGMAGVKRLVLGSVPNKVSHHCPCHLLIVNTDDA